METLVCSNCGANTFEKDKSLYKCKYCGSSKVVAEKKYKKILLFSLVFIFLIALLNYGKIFLMEEKIQNISQSNKQFMSVEKLDGNPFKFLIERVEETIDIPLPTKSLESAIEYYYTLENPKAFNVAYNDSGKYVFGFSSGHSQKNVKEEALLGCKRHKQLSKEVRENDKCMLFLLNDKFVME